MGRHVGGLGPGLGGCASHAGCGVERLRDELQSRPLCPGAFKILIKGHLRSFK